MHPTVKEMHKFALIKATIFLEQEQMIMSVECRARIIQLIF